MLSPDGLLDATALGRGMAVGEAALSSRGRLPGVHQPMAPPVLGRNKSFRPKGSLVAHLYIYHSLPFPCQAMSQEGFSVRRGTWPVKALDVNWERNPCPEELHGCGRPTWISWVSGTYVTSQGPQWSFKDIFQTGDLAWF